MKTKDVSRVTYSERIHQAVNYIGEHLSDEIDLEKLATVACFSPFHFHRIFTAFTGETPRDYIERTKLEQAANRLCVMQNKSVAEIAEDCGFTSASTFSRSFKKHYGVPPVKFLQKHKHDFHSLNVAKERRFPNFQEKDFSSVVIKQLPTYHVAYVQTLEGYATGIPKAWGKLLTFAQMKGLVNESTILLGMPFNNPGVTPREKCRYRACITVPEQIVITRGEVKTADIAAATYGMYHFKGTREDVSDAYAFFYGAWLIQSGYVPDEKPLLELYPLSLMSDCSQNMLEYDIALPIILL